MQKFYWQYIGGLSAMPAGKGRLNHGSKIKIEI
jgi:hypothetical protein